MKKSAEKKARNLLKCHTAEFVQSIAQPNYRNISIKAMLILQRMENSESLIPIQLLK